MSADEPNGPPPYKYTWIPGGLVAGRSPGCDAGLGQPGWPYALLVQDLSGAIVSHVLTELEVVCLPKDLPEFIEVDLATLDVGHSMHGERPDLYVDTLLDWVRSLAA